jgi:hypothetical protein
VIPRIFSDPHTVDYLLSLSLPYDAFMHLEALAVACTSSYTFMKLY